jgi:hypothetical protein
MQNFTQHRPAKALYYLSLVILSLLLSWIAIQWMRDLLYFLAQIGILEAQDLGLAVITLVGFPALIFGVVATIAYVLILLSKKRLFIKCLLIVIVFLFSASVYFEAYSFRSTKPFPKKYWNKNPTSFQECVEVGGIVQIRPSTVSEISRNCYFDRSVYLHGGRFQLNRHSNFGTKKQ